jgi:protein-S-isoprenylcysteine O-methyltransferase Ste14
MPIKTLVIFTSKWAALVFWIALGGLRLVDAWQNSLIISALLAAQSGLITWLLITRSSQVVEAPWPQRVIAWASALLPLAMRVHRETLVGQLITGLGLLLVLWALGTLGRSFGIAPADRGLVKDGPYRMVRHPMYLGELISLAGAVTGDPTTWNVVLMLVLLLSLLLRIRWEERVVFNYDAYAGRVRWRLIPGIW